MYSKAGSYAGKDDTFSDEAKLFKLLEQERLKQAKLNHNQAMT